MGHKGDERHGCALKFCHVGYVLAVIFHFVKFREYFRELIGCLPVLRQRRSSDMEHAGH